jgi:hypothetical protein
MRGDEFLLALLEASIYLMPDARRYVSAAHTEQDIMQTIAMVQTVFADNKAKLMPVHCL